MEKFNNHKLLLPVAFLAIVLSFFMNSLTVHAAPTLEQVYQAAPEGLALEDYMTHTATFTATNDSMTNQAQIIKANSSTYNNPYDIIQMLDANGGKTQLASIWGHRTDDDTNTTVDNYFDLKRKQTVSAWMYFGDKTPYGKDVVEGDTAKGLSDGMAFVLQSDARKSNAISYSTNDGKLATGETLGVWGSSNSTHTPITSLLSIGTGSIKNSFALEFDTLKNNSAGSSDNTIDDFFDGMQTSSMTTQVKGQHIAWGYPFNGSTIAAGSGASVPSSATTTNTYLYNTYRAGLILQRTYYYYGMNHQNPIQNLYLSGDSDTSTAWHHFTFNYDPPTDGSSMATIEYIFNDKNYDGTVRPFKDWDYRTTTIDISKIIDSSSTNPYQVRWGFTASTGSKQSAPSNNAIIMQTMPNVANIDVSSELYDMSQYDSNGNLGRKISDLDKKPTLESSNSAKYNVANGDKLRFDFNLNYLSGFAGTGDEIKTVLKLPDYVDFSADSTTALGQENIIGQIHYSNFDNDADNTTVPIYANELTTDSDGNAIINLTLHKMDTADQTAKVELFGKAAATTTPTTVLGKHASFKSLHFIDDVMTPSFIINDRLNLTTTDNLNLGTINTNDVNNNKVNLNLNLSYQNNSNFDKNNVTLYTQVDNKESTSTVISTADQKNSYDIANNIGNSTQLTAEYLGTGQHTIKVYAVDNLGRTTDAITYTVNVQGTELKLDVDPEFFFQDINYQAASGVVYRKGAWNVKVISSDTPWTLTATADPLVKESDTSQVLGPMFFKDKAGNEKTLVGQTPTIASDDNSDPSLKTTNISDSWSNNDGILLQSEGVKESGQYTSTIKWNLINSL